MDNLVKKNNEIENEIVEHGISSPRHGRLGYQHLQAVNLCRVYRVSNGICWHLIHLT